AASGSSSATVSTSTWNSPSACQAKTGETAYQSNCAGCHGLDLRKVDPEAPDLTESPYRFGW
ncbi:unnamed protein product, partial [Phaeothamnion confervicola]